MPMGSQDDKAIPFKASNKSRGNKSSFVAKPNPNPKRFSGSGLSMAGNTMKSGIYSSLRKKSSRNKP